MAENQAIHECLFCPQIFGTAAAKDEHVLEHFAQETCLECNRDLIRIGGNLYVKHDLSICSIRAPKIEAHIESPVVETFTTQNDTESDLSGSKHAECFESDPTSSSTSNVSIKIEVQQNDSYDDEYMDFTEQPKNSSSDSQSNNLLEQPNYSAFNEPSQAHQNVTAFKCSECNAHFSSVYWLDLHKCTSKKPAHAKNFACTNCEKKFKQKKSLRRHQLREHPSAPLITYEKCEICKKSFGDTEELNLHKTNCVKPTVVKKIRKRDYKDLVPCETCGKIVTKGSLKTHQIAFHSKPGTIFCKTCFKIFPNDDGLLDHRSKCKKNQYRKPRECKICNKVLASAGTFFKHNVLCHSEGKIIFCRRCVKKFKTVEELNEHAPGCALKRKMQKFRQRSKKKNGLPNDKIE